MKFISDFFGIGGYERVAEGAWSWQHILFTLVMVSLLTFLGIFLGIKYKKNEDAKKKIILIAAISINAVEIFKIIMFCIKNQEVFSTILHTLPLFLCSIMLIVLPLAAFSKGKLKESSLDFILIFGLIAGILGIIGAAQNYNAYPVLSIENVSSAVTHSISAFASLFIAVTGMASLKIKNMWISLTILFIVVVLAQIANLTIPYNYMFLENHDGTPYSIFYNLVNGNLILYKMIVIGLFVLLIGIFYYTNYKIQNKKIQK